MKKKSLKSIINKLEKLAVDLPEVRIAADAEYQAKRLKKIIEELKEHGPGQSTEIHGGGTGKD